MPRITNISITEVFRDEFDWESDEENMVAVKPPANTSKTDARL